MFVKLFKTQYDLRKYLGCLVERKHHLFVNLCLIIDEVSQITVLEYQVNEVLVLMHIV